MALVVNMYQKDPFQHNLDIIVFFFLKRKMFIFNPIPCWHCYKMEGIRLLTPPRGSNTHNVSHGWKYTNTITTREEHTNTFMQMEN